MTSEENVMNQYNETVGCIRELERYEKINDMIDAYKLKRGVLPKFIIHGGEYATLYMHPEYETKWKGTFYDKERLLIGTALRKLHSLAKYHYFEKLGERRVQTFWILGYCDSAVTSGDGVRMHLIDPNGEIWLPPFYGMPSSMALVYSGKILAVRIDFTPNGAVIKEAATLPYTLTEKIKEGHPLYDTLTEDCEGDEPIIEECDELGEENAEDF